MTPSPTLNVQLIFTNLTSKKWFLMAIITWKSFLMSQAKYFWLANCICLSISLQLPDHCLPMKLLFGRLPMLLSPRARTSSYWHPQSTILATSDNNHHHLLRETLLLSCHDHLLCWFSSMSCKPIFSLES